MPGNAEADERRGCYAARSSRDRDLAREMPLTFTPSIEDPIRFRIALPDRCAFQLGGPLVKEEVVPIR